MRDTKMLFRSIDVWKKLSSGGAVCYRCFEVLPAGGFCVQSADHYNNEPTIEMISGFNKQHVGLFMEDLPNVRSEVFPLLQTAIERFEKDFSD